MPVWPLLGVPLSDNAAVGELTGAGDRGRTTVALPPRATSWRMRRRPKRSRYNRSGAVRPLARRWPWGVAAEACLASASRLTEARFRTAPASTTIDRRDGRLRLAISVEPAPSASLRWQHSVSADSGDSLSSTSRNRGDDGRSRPAAMTIAVITGRRRSGQKPAPRNRFRTRSHACMGSASCRRK